MKKSICLLLILILTIPPRAALAWSEGGHHIISLIAFGLLGKEDQCKLVAILEKHPRFAEDFAPPAELPNDEEKLRWRIGQVKLLLDGRAKFRVEFLVRHDVTPGRLATPAGQHGRAAEDLVVAG